MKNDQTFNNPYRFKFIPPKPIGAPVNVFYLAYTRFWYGSHFL